MTTHYEDKGKRLEAALEDLADLIIDVDNCLRGASMIWYGEPNAILVEIALGRGNLYVRVHIKINPDKDKAAVEEVIRDTLRPYRLDMPISIEIRDLFTEEWKPSLLPTFRDI